MNAIDFLIIIYHLPAVLSFLFFTSLYVPAHGSQGTHKLVWNFQQLHMETMEYFVILNNVYYQ